MGKIWARPGRSIWLGPLALGLVVLLSGFTFLERLALPRAELIDPFWTKHDPVSTERVDHDAWDRFLETYVSTDAAGVSRVAYGRVSAADRAALGAHLERLAGIPVERLARPEQLAFWVNLYNARTVALVLEHYPVTSIRDIRFGLFSIGPWSEPLLEVRGRKLSLNDIEHGILRPIWQDPRIHYLLNCAALGCPNLGASAYRGATIEQRMEAAAHAYINDPRAVHFDRDGRLIASKIYAWFEEDFGGSPAAVLAHLRCYAGPELAAPLAGRERIVDYAYNWALNDAATAARPQ
jgi:hypothetical protein